MIHNGRSRKLPFDPDEAVAHLRASDAKLAALIDRAAPFTLRLDPAPSPFESLLESILYQQLHGKAAATIHRRVREYFGGDPAPQALLDTPDEPLRAAGVSGNKIKALRDLAATTLDGTVPTHARHSENVRRGYRRAADRGARHRPVDGGDAADLPPGPAGRAAGDRLRRAQGLRADLSAACPRSRPLAADDLPKPDVVFKRGKRWAPFRSVASWYLWRACDLARNTAPHGRSEPTIAHRSNAGRCHRGSRDGMELHACKQALCLHSRSFLSAAARESRGWRR